MQVSIVKRKTKSFRLSVNANGEAKLSAPPFATKKQIEFFLQTHQDWLTSAVNKVLEKKQEKDNKLKEYEGKVLYLGKWFSLTLDANAKGVVLDNDTVICKNKSVFDKWRKKEALRIFSAKCEKIADFYGVTLGKISTRAAKSRWGSCSISGNISLNTHLIKAPFSIIEYVIIHEIAHRLEHNHSKAFWAQVAKLCADYKAQDKWLKQNGWLLSSEES